MPYPLICDYAFKSIPFVSFNNPYVWISLILYVVFIYICIKYILNKQINPLSFSLLFFLVTISIFSNITFLIGAEMGERFLFFPSVGFCLFISFLLEKFLSEKDQAGYNIIFNPRLLSVVIPVSLIYVLLTIFRNQDWRDNYTLFSRDIEKVPNNCRLLTFLGGEELERFTQQNLDGENRNENLKRGIVHLQKSLSIYKNQADAHRYLGAAFATLKQNDSVVRHCNIAISLDSFDCISMNNLAIVYMSQLKFSEALELEKKASRINPDNEYYLLNMGICYSNLKFFNSALSAYKKANKINPENRIIKKFLMESYHALGQADTIGVYQQ